MKAGNYHRFLILLACIAVSAVTPHFLPIFSMRNMIERLLFFSALYFACTAFIVPPLTRKDKQETLALFILGLLLAATFISLSILAGSMQTR